MFASPRRSDRIRRRYRRPGRAIRRATEAAVAVTGGGMALVLLAGLLTASPVLAAPAGPGGAAVPGTRSVPVGSVAAKLRVSSRTHGHGVTRIAPCCPRAVRVRWRSAGHRYRWAGCP